MTRPDEKDEIHTEKGKERRNEIRTVLSTAHAAEPCRFSRAAVLQFVLFARVAPPFSVQEGFPDLPTTSA